MNSAETPEPFVDIVQRALIRPERHLFTAMRWKDVRSAATGPVASTARDISSARVFRLSDDFVRLAAETSMTSPETVANSLTCARAPYDRIWIEFSESARLQSLAGYVSPEAASRIGYFIERVPGTDTQFRATAFWNHLSNADATKHPRAERLLNATDVYMSPLSFQWTTDGSPIVGGGSASSLLWRPLGIGPINDTSELQSSGWGENLASLIESGVPLLPIMLLGRGWVDQNHRRGVQQSAKSRLALDRLYTSIHACLGPGWFANLGSMTPDQLKAYGKASLIMRAAIGFEGDARFVMSVLSLLQSKWIESKLTRPSSGVRLIHTHRAKWLDVHDCYITAPKERIVRAYDGFVKSAAARRRHEVMGHFCERRGTGSRSCLHAYEKAATGIEVCGHCGHTRWWRNPHFRGDESVGVVSKTYRIEAP